MRRFATPVIVVSLILVGIGGFILGGWGMIRSGNENARLIKINHELNRKIGEKEVVLFFLKSTPTNFYLKPVLFQVKNNEDQYLKTLEALLAGPPNGSRLIALFPKGTKVLGLKIKNGIAYVNLNRNATQLNVGSSGEALAIASIVNTLTKFPEIFRVKILVEGKEVESLAGHVDLTGFLHYDDQVVDPELF